MPLSTTSAERSFSVLRHHTMTDYRLTGLPLMNIHPEIKINSDEVLKQSDATGKRRVNFNWVSKVYLLLIF